MRKSSLLLGLGFALAACGSSPDEVGRQAEPESVTLDVAKTDLIDELKSEVLGQRKIFELDLVDRNSKGEAVVKTLVDVGRCALIEEYYNGETRPSLIPNPGVFVASKPNDAGRLVMRQMFGLTATGFPIYGPVKLEQFDHQDELLGEIQTVASQPELNGSLLPAGQGLSNIQNVTLNVPNQGLSTFQESSRTMTGLTVLAEGQSMSLEEFAADPRLPLLCQAAIQDPLSIYPPNSSEDPLFLR